MGGRALIQLDELIDLCAGEPAGPIGEIHEVLQARPTTAMRGYERVDVHNPAD